MCKAFQSALTLINLRMPHSPSQRDLGRFVVILKAPNLRRRGAYRGSATILRVAVSDVVERFPRDLHTPGRQPAGFLSRLTVIKAL